MSWDDFALAWSEAYDGYDLRRASPLKQRFMRAIYKISGVVRVSGSVTMLISILCSVAVPLLAWRGGLWTTLAVPALLLGQAADAMTGARFVRSSAATPGASGSSGVSAPGASGVSAAGRITRLDGFYQALVERFAEVCWLVALLALGARPVAVVLCGFVVWAHEYLRAKVGGGAGGRWVGSTTVGDRQPRVWFMVTALLLAALISRIGSDLAAGVVTMVVLCWLALGLIGLGQLFAVIRKALT